MSINKPSVYEAMRFVCSDVGCALVHGKNKCERKGCKCDCHRPRTQGDNTSRRAFVAAAKGERK